MPEEPEPQTASLRRRGRRTLLPACSAVNAGMVYGGITRPIGEQNMKKLALAAMIGMLSAGAFAAQGDILARFRVIDVDPSSSWDNSAVAGLNVEGKSAVAPELDFTYMITNNIGAELILGTSRHKVTTNASAMWARYRCCRRP